MDHIGPLAADMGNRCQGHPVDETEAINRVGIPSRDLQPGRGRLPGHRSLVQEQIHIMAALCQTLQHSQIVVAHVCFVQSSNNSHES